MASLPVRIQQNSPQHIALRVLGVLALAYVFVLPLLREQAPVDYQELTHIVAFAIAALSLNLLVGFTGQISIGHSAFFGVGAYTTAILIDRYEWTAGWTFPVAALIAFAVGVVVGIPALRLTGVYLSLVTLALAQLFPRLIEKFSDFTGGVRGIGGLSYDPPEWTWFESGRLGRAQWLYFLALVILALCYVVKRNLVKSRVGRAMVAVRDNPTAAAVMGVHVSVVKTAVFGISAAMAGLGGCIFALFVGAVNANADTTYQIIGAILFLVIMVIGGTGSLVGPIIGAFLYYRIEHYLRDIQDKDYVPETASEFLTGRLGLATLLLAALLIASMYFAPFGIAGSAKRLGRRLVVVTPNVPTSASEAAPEAGPSLPSDEILTPQTPAEVETTQPADPEGEDRS